MLCIYLFIYLVSFLLLSFHSCCPRLLLVFVFGFFSSFPLTLGPLGEGCNACSVCGVTGLRQDSCYSSLTSVGAPSLLMQVGLGSMGGGGRGTLTGVYRIDV